MKSFLMNVNFHVETDPLVKFSGLVFCVYSHDHIRPFYL